MTVDTLTLPRVPADEAAPFYGEFLAAFPDGQPGDVKELPGFDENVYVPVQRTTSRY